MKEIVASVNRISQVINDIMTAADEQAVVSVKSSRPNLDQMTQQNSALVDESGAAAESLRDEARHLATVIRTFRLEHDAGRSGHMSGAGNVSTRPAASSSSGSRAATPLNARNSALRLRDGMRCKFASRCQASGGKGLVFPSWSVIARLTFACAQAIY
jgi:methyl-accepting chemotaxis protein